MKTLRVHLRSGLQLFMITSIASYDGDNREDVHIIPDSNPVKIMRQLSQMPEFAIVLGAAAKHPGVVRVEDICFIGIDEREEE